MRKFLVLLLIAVLLVISLVGCGGDRRTYEEVATAIEAEDFEGALELLDSIPDFEDTENLREQAEIGIIQRTAEEYLVYRVENGGFHAPTSARVLRAGYTSAEGGCSSSIIFESTGIFWFTIQATTLGGGERTGDSVILYGGERDRQMMSNDDPGNDYDSMEQLLDVGRLNAVLREHWISLGVITE